MLNLSEKLLLTEYAVSQGIRVFWIEHDRIGRWLRWNPWLPRLRRLAKLATTVVVSDLSREMYLQLGWPEERTVTIVNGIDVERFSPKKVSGTLSKRFLTPFCLGCIARLTKDKGVDLLIETIAELPNVRLTIIGTGREERKLRTIIDRINRNHDLDRMGRETHATPLRSRTDPVPRIVLLPSVPDLPAFYHSLDALVLPSRDHDPFGLTAAEAMASGIPVIATVACGISRHLKEGEALIVRSGSVLALRSAIEELQNPERRKSLGEQGMKAARERFVLPRMIEEYEWLFAV